MNNSSINALRLAMALMLLWPLSSAAQITINGTEITFPDTSTQSTASGGGSSLLRTIIVSPVPGDAIASGTAFRNAYNAVSGASAANPYVVKLEPGVFDLGATTLNLKSYVHICGTTRTSTIIRSSYGGDINIGGLDADGITIELRSFTLERTATSNVVGIWCFDTTMLIEDVNLKHTETIANAGYGVGVDGSATRVTMRNCQIEIPNYGSNSLVYGVYNTGGIADIHNSQITLNGAQTSIDGNKIYGCNNIDGTGTTNLRNSTVSAYDAGGSVLARGVIAFGGTINAGSTELYGTTAHAGSTNVNLVNCWDNNFNPIANQ